MNIELNKLKKLIEVFSKETQIMDDLLPEIRANIKRANKLFGKLSIFNIKSSFNIFEFDKSQKQKVFHICNKTNYCLRNIINLSLRLKNKYKSFDIIDELFNIVVKCINKLVRPPIP